MSIGSNGDPHTRAMPKLADLPQAQTEKEFDNMEIALFQGPEKAPSEPQTVAAGSGDYLADIYAGNVGLEGPSKPGPTPAAYSDLNRRRKRKSADHDGPKKRPAAVGKPAAAEQLDAARADPPASPAAAEDHVPAYPSAAEAASPPAGPASARRVYYDWDGKVPSAKIMINRVRSKAYHDEENKCLGLGLDEISSKDRARTAGRDAVSRWKAHFKDKLEVK